MMIRQLLMSVAFCCCLWTVSCQSNTTKTDSALKKELNARTQREGVECSLPKLTGFSNCSEQITRYYYDTAEGKCKSFQYTGCGGNLNNFDHEDECTLRCVCSRPKDVGNGNFRFTRYFYNTASKKCEAFRYRGSNGNVNNFLTTTSCLNVCEPSKRRCKTRPDFGRTCVGKPSSTEYYYDKNCDCCRPFTFLGCNGNKNRFSSEETCLKKCSDVATTPMPPTQRPDFCFLQAVPGYCNQIFTRYYFDISSNRCLPFTYTGCGGNNNNFVKPGECRRTCNAQKSAGDTQGTAGPDAGVTTTTTTTTESNLPSFCDPEPSRGHCQFNLNRYFYDKRDGICKKFNWSGCGGNLNRFTSIRHCEISCQGS